jgi:Arc/MetJ-type ribon-helix-helix transcriptional regulator
MTIQVTVRLTEAELRALDAAIARGWFANRSDALRSGLERILYAERQHEIDQLYIVGYGKHPQEAWVGEFGLAGFSAFDRAEGGAPI